MKRHHYGILALTLLLLGVLAGYSLFKNGLVPVAWVEGEVIFLREVQENAEVSRRIYEQAPGLSADSDLEGLFSGGEEEVFRRALEVAIVNKIVRSGASADEREAAARRVASSVEGSAGQLTASLERLYGWDVETFTERVLTPQALLEVLAEKKGDDYTDWLRQVRRDANVRVWLVPFVWLNGELVEK